MADVLAVRNEYRMETWSELQTTIRQQQAEIGELKKKLDHMNEILLNAQRARFGQSSEKKAMFWAKAKSVCLTKRNWCRTTRQKSLPRKPSRPILARKSAPLLSRQKISP